MTEDHHATVSRHVGECDDQVTTPKLSIGLPVFNAERYLVQALDSILAQTFSDFEVIVSDNASTDRTQSICEAYQRKDPRIRYVRNESNIGAAANFNQTVHMARGEYFRWAADDDVIEPTYLERCIELLEANPDAAVCQTKVRIIDGEGRVVREYDDLLDFRSESPCRRFREYLFRPASMWNAIFGVMRKDVLMQTPLLGGYPSADQPLLGELVLRGKVLQVSERLFSRRKHEAQSWQANPTTRALAEWFDPSNRDRIVLPKKLKLFFEYLRAIWRAPLGVRDRFCCYALMMRWGAKRLLWRPFSMAIRSPSNRVA